MADPCLASVRLVTVAHSSALGVATAYRGSHSVVDLAIPGEGKKGPSCRPIIAEDSVWDVDFLTGSPEAVDTGPATLTITEYMGSGATKTISLATMKSRGYDRSFDRASPPAKWTQRFVYVGDMDSDNLTVS